MQQKECQQDRMWIVTSLYFRNKIEGFPMCTISKRLLSDERNVSKNLRRESLPVNERADTVRKFRRLIGTQSDNFGIIFEKKRPGIESFLPNYLPYSTLLIRIP